MIRKLQKAQNYNSATLGSDETNTAFFQLKRIEQKSTMSLAQWMNVIDKTIMKNKSNKIYHSKNHSKFILTYHIIFVCKYREKVLSIFGEYIKQIMFDISKKYDFEIKEMEVDKDYVYGQISSKNIPIADCKSIKTTIHNKDMEKPL